MTDQGKTLKVGVTAYRDITPATVGSLFQLREATPFGLDITATMATHVARNMIISRLTEDYILFVDSDMMFTPAQVGALMGALGEDPKMGMVSGLYIKWDGSGEPIVNWKQGRKWVDDKEKFRRVVKYMQEGALKPVDTCGLGFSLIDTAVFKRIKDPYFEFAFDKKGNPLTEDTVFISKLKRAKYHPSVHFGVQVGHVGPTLHVPPHIPREPDEDEPDTTDEDEIRVQDQSEAVGG